MNNVRKTQKGGNCCCVPVLYNSSFPVLDLVGQVRMNQVLD